MSTHTAEEIAAGEQRREDIRAEDADRRHRIAIKGRGTMPYDLEVTLDGEPIKGLCSMTFDLNPDRLVTVTMELEAILDVDVELAEDEAPIERWRVKYHARPPRNEEEDLP